MRILARLPAGDSSAGVYGTLLWLSVLVGLTIDDVAAGPMLVTVGVSAAVFWLAHVHAGVVGRWVQPDARPGRAAVMEVMRDELPMLESAAPVMALLLLAWVGVLGQATAVWLSLAYGIAALVVWGLLIARQAALGAFGVFLVAGINLALGLLIVLLKLLVH